MAVDLEYYGVPPADYRELENRTRLVATAGQTTFSAPYSVGYADVYFNGAKLDAFTDFTGTDGANIVLSIAAAAGDIVEVISRPQVQVSDTYTQQQVNALASNYYGVATGTGNAQIVTTSPTFTTYVDGMNLKIRAVAPNVSQTPTIAPNGLAVKTIVRDGGLPLTGADWNTGSELTLRYNQTAGNFTVVDGLVTATTPTVFDNTSKFATTNFVQQNGFRFTTIYSLSTTTTLTLVHVGALVYVATASSPVTLTLPSASTLPEGATISFFSATTQPVSVACPGTDHLQVSSNTLSSLVMGNGDSITLTCNGVNLWIVNGGSVQLGASSAFGSVVGSPGWQKLPSGFIIQWGAGTTPNGSTIVSFPVSYPNVVLSTVVNSGVGTGSFCWSVTNQITTGFAIASYISPSGAATTSNTNFQWISIGH